MKLPPSVAMKCPMCGKPLDLQGTGRTGSGWYTFELWCHDCVAQICVNVRPSIARNQTGQTSDQPSASGSIDPTSTASLTMADKSKEIQS